MELVKVILRMLIILTLILPLTILLSMVATVLQLYGLSAPEVLGIVLIPLLMFITGLAIVADGVIKEL